MDIIGKIVKSNSHIDYVCQVFSAGEVAPVPSPTAYAFGAFMAIQLEEGGAPAGELIAVVYNTQLMNPDFGNYGPRLSSRADLEIFSPDYLLETATLLGLLAIGYVDRTGRVVQGVPAPASMVNATVRSLSVQEFERFHRTPAGQLSLRYVPVLLGQQNPLVAPLLLDILARLEAIFPAEVDRLTVMRNNLAWRRMVAPAG